MASKEELEEQISRLQAELAKKDKVVVSRDRKFSTLSSANSSIEVSEWLKNITTYVGNRFSNDQEKVMFIFDHLEKNAKTELRFRADINKATVSEVVKILTELYSPDVNAVELQQKFYSRNQDCDESIEEYAFDLLDIFTSVCEKVPVMRVNKDEVVKHKFADGVRNKQLKQELYRINDERPSLSFWQVRTHALQFENRFDNTVLSNQIDSDMKNATQSTSACEATTLRYKDMVELVQNQQKQLDNLTKLVAELKPTQGKRYRSVQCYFCKKEGHVKSRCLLFKKQQQGEKTSDLNSKNPTDQ